MDICGDLPMLRICQHHEPDHREEGAMLRCTHLTLAGVDAEAQSHAHGQGCLSPFATALVAS